MFYQTVGEIERLWGRAGMSSWRDGCSATIMGPVSSRTSAQDLSAMMGTRMLRVKTESTSASSPVMSPMSGSVSTSEQEQLRDVALITPTAISQLPPHASIITATGRKPILASKAIWFTREDMKDRVRNTDEIKDELAVTEEQEKLTKRLRELSQVDEETARWASVSRADLVAMQRRNMDDDPDPDDGTRLLGQRDDVRPLSEREGAGSPVRTRRGNGRAVQARRGAGFGPSAAREPDDISSGRNAGTRGIRCAGGNRRHRSRRRPDRGRSGASRRS
ncbi:MAG: type IV secretory system conjugative DNA transfer family protein [Boseongicola sp. SB0675_bin_26]|nr:type IV secretory system conjugative DNA transfer family protein [Boseongicola sp. SB0675_bin_26]